MLCRSSQKCVRRLAPFCFQSFAPRLRWALQAWLLAALTSAAFAQTLARPGWNGSGFNADPWWNHAVFYEVRTGSYPTSSQGLEFKAVTAKLDALQSLGIDALILPMPALPVQAQAVQAQLGSIAGPSLPGAGLDDFDELMRQASSRSIRVLLTFPDARITSALSPVARFWLSRGVSGFLVVRQPGASAQDEQSAVQVLRAIANSAVGGRIVISDFDPNANGSSAPSLPTTRDENGGGADRSGKPAGAQLQVDSRMGQLELPGAASLRFVLAQSLLQPNLLLDTHPLATRGNSPDPYSTLAKAMAAIALTTHAAALIDADESLALQADAQPAVPADATLADWYRKLAALHHGNATLRYGSVTTIDEDGQNALVWAIRPASASALAPPIVVVCNLSSSQVQLSLTAAMKGLNLHGSFLRPLLRSYEAMGAQNLDAVTIPAFGVFIGELRR